MLTLEEVLAVRLYSGPAFQPINNFLRQVSSLRGEHRRTLARHPTLSFSATVGHICRAIRKLSAVATPEESEGRLWRAVRGELPAAFWLPNEHGMVCAVDLAFMSTSRNRQTPLDYMGDGQNVLWEVHTTRESDTGFHCGANIALLSQFAAESEVLFPPSTMLMLLPHGHAPGQAESEEQENEGGVSAVAPPVQHPPSQVETRHQDGRSIMHVCVPVIPYFL